LTLLVAFSTGLAVVLMALGMAAVYTRRLLPASEKASGSALFRYLPVASAALIACVGAVMTAVALGVVRVAR
jgi:nickel/cobalt exporter